MSSNEYRHLHSLPSLNADGNIFPIMGFPEEEEAAQPISAHRKEIHDLWDNEERLIDEKETLESLLRTILYEAESLIHGTKVTKKLARKIKKLV